MLFFLHTCIYFVLAKSIQVTAFQAPSARKFRSSFLGTTSSPPSSPLSLCARSKKLLLLEEPLATLSQECTNSKNENDKNLAAFGDIDGDDEEEDSRGLVTTAMILPTVSLTSLSTLLPDQASAAQIPLSTGSFDPSTFQPVCSASDGFYRFLQGFTQGVVGPENFSEYGPLIAGGLLRIRLELCVVESFFNEAVGPFIQQNGLNWILPLHETVETFLAGVVFSLATTFILVGSTKILTVIFTYADFLIGMPFRSFGGFAFDRVRGKPVTLDIGFGPFKTRVIGPKDYEKQEGQIDYTIDLDKTKPAELPLAFLSGGVKFTGDAIGLLRKVLDAVDLFVGRYLVLWVTAYIGVKFLHFKVFPDFPPF